MPMVMYDKKQPCFQKTPGSRLYARAAWNKRKNTAEIFLLCFFCTENRPGKNGRLIDSESEKPLGKMVRGIEAAGKRTNKPDPEKIILRYSIIHTIIKYALSYN